MWFKIYGHFFFYKNYDTIVQKMLTSSQKKNPTEQILIWYCVLRVTYIIISILNQLC